MTSATTALNAAKPMSRIVSSMKMTLDRHICRLSRRRISSRGNQSPLCGTKPARNLSTTNRRSSGASGTLSAAFCADAANISTVSGDLLVNDGIPENPGWFSASLRPGQSRRAANQTTNTPIRPLMLPKSRLVAAINKIRMRHVRYCVLTRMTPFASSASCRRRSLSGDNPARAVSTVSDINTHQSVSSGGSEA